MKANTHSILCLIRLFACFALLSLATASCEPPVPFAPPTWINASLNATFRTIEATLKQYFASEAFQSSSCSVQISSSDHTLWNAFHTANGTQAGAPVINGSVVYRIASNTKIFTAMAILQQQAEGKINLDDPITQYVANLGGGKHDHIRWDRISVRSLMSHMSGIQDNCELLGSHVCKIISKRASANSSYRRRKRSFGIGRGFRPWAASCVCCD